MRTSTTDMLPNGMALIRTFARPVSCRQYPRQKPPATSHSTFQLISLISSLPNRPVAVNTPSGIRATILELIWVICSVAHRRMVPTKVIHTTYSFQSFLRLLSGISSTSFLVLNGKNTRRSTQAIRIMIST